MRTCLGRLHISDVIDCINYEKITITNEKIKNEKVKSKNWLPDWDDKKKIQRNKNIVQKRNAEVRKKQQKNKIKHKRRTKTEEEGRRRKAGEERKDAKDSRKRREGKMKKEGGLLYESFRRKPGWRFTAGSTFFSIFYSTKCEYSFQIWIF